MINSIKPMRGSGDGISEYSYQLYLQLKKENTVKEVYAIDRARKNDIIGLIKVNTMLSSVVAAASKESHDIFHITNQEVGFAANDVRTANPENKVVTTIHDVSRFERNMHKGALQKAFNEIVKRSIKIAIKNSDFLIFNSSLTKQETLKHFRINRSAVINIGISSEFSRNISGRRNSVFTVGYIGSFAHHKNVGMLFDAAKLSKGRKTKFIIYGEGAERKNLERFKIKNGLENLRMMGFAPESRKVSIYDSFDAFVFPSLYEGFGIPIIEAQARGLPVIIYKNGKIPKEVRKYCLEADNEEHMAQIIESLKKNGYNERIRKKATEYARSFTWGKCAKETLKVYNNVLNG